MTLEMAANSIEQPPIGSGTTSEIDVAVDMIDRGSIGPLAQLEVIARAHAVPVRCRLDHDMGHSVAGSFEHPSLVIDPSRATEAL